MQGSGVSPCASFFFDAAFLPVKSPPNCDRTVSRFRLASLIRFSNSHHGYGIHKRELILDCERVGLRGRKDAGVAMRLSHGYDGGVIAVRRLVGLNLMTRLMELVNQRATFRRPPVDVQCNVTKFRTGPRIVGLPSPITTLVYDNVIGE